jgi:hypothetical protein
MSATNENKRTEEEQQAQTNLKVIEAKTGKQVDIIFCPYAIGTESFYSFLSDLKIKYPCADRRNQTGYKIQELK